MVFEWRLHNAKIIAVDKMLDAIEASPLTTPTLRQNVSLRNWERDFRLHTPNSTHTQTYSNILKPSMVVP
ncbi:hypothetical protein N7501_009742 [Penicillium viridicatum]|nr:hypothetical protein N7501_009742 [Penicillium viridicatum]